MTESTPVSLNLQSPNISTVVYAVQNDRSARHIVAQLRDGSAPWTPPAGAAPVIRYVKPDGTGGFYDADDNNNSAIVISGSKADMTIVEQALTVPGDVYMQLHFYAGDGTRLTSFAWILRVQQSVLNDATIVSSDYFNVLTAKVSQAVQAASAAAESAAEAAASAASISIPLPITSGGTGATTDAGARENIGLGNVANERQYSAQNPPPYPVKSVNGQTGDVTVQAATDAQVATAVNTWLGNNVDPATGYVLDRTLTMSNAAPPASAVGELKSAFLRRTHPGDNVAVDLIFEQGSYYNSTANDLYVVDANWGHTDKIAITAGKTYFINTPTNQYISFYDSNGNFISGLAGVSATAPDNAAFIRISSIKARQPFARLTADFPYKDYVNELQSAVGKISFANYPETLTEVLTDHSMKGSGYIYTGANDVNIDPSYGAIITFTNRSNATVTMIGYLTQNGNNVVSMTTGNVSLQARQTYTWDIPAIADKPYGSWEGFFSANYVGICINNVNNANITVTVKQRGNIFVDGLRREKHTVLCNPKSTGGGIFNNIQKAINWLKAHYNVATTPCTVFLMNGTYTLNYVSSRNAVIDKGANRISIVGESRDGVKLVLTSTPAQNNKIIEHGGPSILENISFYNLWNADGSTPSYVNNSYCIHNDLGFTTDEAYDTVVKNCYVYSEAFAPIGAGLWKNQKQRYIDVEAVFNSLDERPNGYNQWAPIYIHGPSQPNQPNCSVEIDGCTCIAQKGTMAIVLPNVPDRTPYTEIPVSIRRTIGTTTGSTITNVSKATHDLQPDSALNNVDAWNY